MGKFREAQGERVGDGRRQVLLCKAVKVMVCPRTSTTLCDAMGDTKNLDQRGSSNMIDQCIKSYDPCL
jgi:hypothetical protein